jgi:transposase
MQLEELEAAATEDEIAAGKTKTTAVAGFERRRPARKPFPEHLPRERVVIDAPTACSCCGSDRIVKMGEDITETLEVIPRQWKVIQTVREKFTCRACEKISQPPAPFHPTPRGWAGPNLLAMILFEKFGQHQPLNRQAERYAKEGVDLSLSTLADQVGACTAALAPIHALIRNHVLAAELLHGDDTTVPLLAKGRRQRGSGPMSATTGLLAAARHRPRCSTSRATGRWRIRTGILRGGRAFSRPMPMAATTTSIAVIVIQGLC